MSELKACLRAAAKENRDQSSVSSIPANMPILTRLPAYHEATGKATAFTPACRCRVVWLDHF